MNPADSKITLADPFVARGANWVYSAADQALPVVKTQLWDPSAAYMFKNKNNIAGFAMVLLLMYGGFRFLANKGETRAMQAKEYKQVTLVKHDGTKEKIVLTGPIELTPEKLATVKTVKTKVVDAETYIIKQIDSLKTREEVIAWLITYQHLTCDGNGKDVVPGTVASGLATVLRGALAGENLRLLDGSATKAIVDTLKEIRDNGHLGWLNRTDMQANKDFQLVEIQHHRNNIGNYDAFGRAMTNLCPNLRTLICKVASCMEGLPKAILGGTKLLTNQ